MVLLLGSYPFQIFKHTAAMNASFSLSIPVSIEVCRRRLILTERFSWPMARVYVHERASGDERLFPSGLFLDDSPVPLAVSESGTLVRVAVADGLLGLMERFVASYHCHQAEDAYQGFRC